MPAVTPVTTPPLTVATALLLLLQTPPLVVEEYVVVNPTQTVLVPVNAATTGKAFTLIVVVAESIQPLTLDT